MTLAELIVKVGADISDYTKGIDDALAKTSTMEGAFEGFGTTMSEAVTAPLAALGTAALEAASTMKEAFNQIVIQTGAAGDKLNDLKSSMSSVFAGVPESARQVADAISSISQRLDLTGEPLQALSAQMLNLARITGSEVKPMVDSVAKAFNAFKISTDQQGESLDFLFSVFQHTGATVQSLTDGLTQYGAQFKSLGLDFEQSAALLGEFEKEGVNAGAAMTGLRKALSEMAKTGMDTSNGFADIVDWIKKAGTEAEGLQRSIEIFGAKGGASMFQAIKDGAADLGTLTKAFAATHDQINATADKVETFGEKLKKLWHGVEEALAPVGQVLRGLLNSGFDALQPMLGILQDLSRAFQELDPFTQKVVVSLGLLAAAAGPAALAISKLASTQAIGSVVSAFSQLMTTGAALEGGALTGFLGALPALAIPAAAALTGLALAWSQFHVDTEGLRSLDASFNQMLVDMTKGTIGPLTDGVGRFDQVIQTLNKSLEAGVITLDQFNKLMLMVDTNQKAADKADMSAWTSSFGLKILPTGKDSGKINPLDLAKQQEAAKQYAADLAAAFSTLGVTDYVTQIQKLKDAYELLASSGKATGQELRDAWFKVQQAEDAYATSLQGITDQIQFNASEQNKAILAGIDATKLDAIAEAAKTHLDAIKEQTKAFWKDQQEFIENFDTSTEAALQDALDKYEAARQALVSSPSNPTLLPDFSGANEYKGIAGVPNSPGTSLSDLRAYADLANQVVGVFAQLKIPDGTKQDLAAFSDSLAKSISSEKVEEFKQLNDALKTLGVTARDDAGKMKNALDVATEAYRNNEIGLGQFMKAQLSALQSQANEARALGENIPVELSSQIYALQTKLANMTKDVWAGVHNEVTSLVGTLDDGLSKAILDFGNFGKDMEATFKKMGQQLLDTVFKAFTKPFADSLAKTISDAVAPTVSKISKWMTGLLSGGGGPTISALSSLPTTASSGISMVSTVSGFTEAGSLASGGASAAGAATSGASSVAGAAGSLSSLGSIASIANIAGAASSILSGIVQGIQGAHMNNLLGEIEISTRGSLNEALNLRRDFWDATNGLRAIANMTYDRLGEFQHDVMVKFDMLYDRVGQIVGGSSTVTQNADGSVTAAATIFTDLTTAVHDGTQAIVDAVNGAADRIVKGVTTPAPSEPTTTTGVDTTQTVATTPTETQAVFAPVGFSQTTPLPENQNVVNTLISVNTTLTEGFQAVVDQLKNMGSLSTGTSTATSSGTSSSNPGTTGDTGDPLIDGVKNMLAQGASHSAIMQWLTDQGASNVTDVGGTINFERGGGSSAPSNTPIVPFTMTDDTAALSKVSAAAQSVSDAYVQSLLSSGLYVQNGDGSLSLKVKFALTEDTAALQKQAADAASVQAAYVQSLMDTGLYVMDGAGRLSTKQKTGLTAGPDIRYPNQDPANQAYMHPAIDWTALEAARNAMPDIVYPSAPSIPGSVNSSQMTPSIVVQNNVFRDKEHIDYLLNLVQAQM